MSKRKKNARFWTYWNGGWVKLTVRPGEDNSVLLYSGGQTEEGFRQHWERYHIEDGLVYRRTLTVERDCDGRHESDSEFVCPMDQLSANEADPTIGKPASPAWERESSFNRDEFAESMNY